MDAQRPLIFDSPLVVSDLPRLGEQMQAVAEVMQHGSWYTLSQLRQILQFRGIAASESGISARIRDLRKPPLNWTIERKRVEGGLFAYRNTTTARSNYEN